MHALRREAFASQLVAARTSALDVGILGIRYRTQLASVAPLSERAARKRR